MVHNEILVIIFSRMEEKNTFCLMALLLALSFHVFDYMATSQQGKLGNTVFIASNKMSRPNKTRIL